MGNTQNPSSPHEQIVMTQAKIITNQSEVTDKLDKFGLIVLGILGVIIIFILTIALTKCKTSIKDWLNKQVSRSVDRNMQEQRRIGTPQVVIE